MIAQSENNIRKSALRFLKMYYKNRPRSGETSTKINQSAQGGIIADGLLEFPKEDGTRFLASVEATSFDTRNEVKFKYQHALLYWDCLMAACALTAFVVLVGHYFKWFTFQSGNWELGLGLATLFIGGFFLYKLGFQSRSKYSYIYALEQFKKYFADEQWVAIGDNVFYGPDDPMLEELRKQCVYNGFGLLSVDKELNTHLVISPSRDEIFGQGRKLTNFIGISKMRKTLQSKRLSSIWANIKKPLGLGQISTSLTRYQKNYYKQIFVSVLMLGLIGFVAWEDLREKDVLYVNEAEFNKELEAMAKNRTMDDRDLTLDSSAIQPYSKDVPDSYIAVVETDKRDEQSVGGEIIRREKLLPKGKKEEKEEAKIFVSTGSEGITIYNDCDRIMNFSGKKYLVQDGEFKTFPEAERRMSLLIRKGYNPSILWFGCFYENSKNYCVFIDVIYNDIREAKDQAGIYKYSP